MSDILALFLSHYLALSHSLALSHTLSRTLSRSHTVSRTLSGQFYRNSETFKNFILYLFYLFFSKNTQMLKYSISLTDTNTLAYIYSK